MQAAEIFKDIPGFNGLYQASNKGNVKSVRNGIVLKQRFSKGYKRVNVSIDGLHKTYPVHRLIASAFIDNPENKSQINHKDGNKANNHFSNLEWATGSENIRHAQATGLKSIPVPPRFERGNHPHNKRVLRFSKSGELIQSYNSVELAAAAVGGKSRPIAAVCRGDKKTYKGEIYKYAV